ncbi:MAG: glycosyl hydrolase 115 family protein [Treponema sp.]|nr:glycosyl hydrolase 115 family protein [Treponema sp.]
MKHFNLKAIEAGLIFALAASPIFSQEFVVENAGGKSSVSFYQEEGAFSGLVKIAEKVQQDIKQVTGAEPSFKKDLSACGENTVIFASLGNSALLDSLAQNKKIDLDAIKGKNEVYSFSILESPFPEYPNIKNLLLIAGSDKRGTIYGLFHLSELMGVSPLSKWLGENPVSQKKVIFDSSKNFVSKEPSVKYRGFFINDEWPAFGEWANKRFGGVNAKCYEGIFELLLRMKGNYMWPAMWSSNFSADGPGLASAQLADEYGVIMGTSHHEPCCRAGVEFGRLKSRVPAYGKEWNFAANEAGITKFWEDGLKRNGKFENVITVGMRGEADSAILGRDATLADNINLLRNVLKVQNKLIRENVNQNLDQVPRMFALYKEVEPFFYGDENTKGLIGSPELDGVTLLLCDDNHGNLRTLPTEEMRNHKGGYGMYYHLDYHGGPVSYEWINTSYIPKIKEQMCQAYEFGVQELWIVNVGDIATNEFPLNYFMDLAYDYPTYSADSMTGREYAKIWSESQFSILDKKTQEEIADILDSYTKLAHLRRTESIKIDTFSAINDNEAENLLARIQEVMDKTENLKSRMPEEAYLPFYSQVYYPTMGTLNVIKIFLNAALNKWYISKGLPTANEYAKATQLALNFDESLVKEYHKVGNGRWVGMGNSKHIGFTTWNDKNCKNPEVKILSPSSTKEIAVWIEGEDKTNYSSIATKNQLILDSFKNPDVQEAKINVAQYSDTPVKYKVSLANSNSFINYEIVKDTHQKMDTIIVQIDRDKLAKAKSKEESIIISGKSSKGKFQIPVLVDASPLNLDYPAGTFIQTGDTVTIEAAHYSSKKDFESCEFKELPAYGKNLSAIKAYPVTKYFDSTEEAPYVEYKLVLEKDATYNFRFYTNPSNPVAPDNKLQFIAEINGEKNLVDCVTENFVVGNGSWNNDVLNNIRTLRIRQKCKAGLNTIRIYPVTPGFVLERIVLSANGVSLKDSYLGGPESYRVK